MGAGYSLGYERLRVRVDDPNSYEGFADGLRWRTVRAPSPIWVLAILNPRPLTSFALVSFPPRPLHVPGSPQVCRFIQTGMVDDRNFMAMELLGPSLSDVRKKRGGGALPVHLIVDLGMQVYEEGTRQMFETGLIGSAGGWNWGRSLGGRGIWAGKALLNGRGI